MANIAVIISVKHIITVGGSNFGHPVKPAERGGSNLCHPVKPAERGNSASLPDDQNEKDENDTGGGLEVFSPT